MLQRLVCQGNKLKDEPLEALAMCHAGRDEMISIQLSAAEIIRQSDDEEIHTIFDLSYTNSSTIDIQGTIYVKVLIIKFWCLN